MCNGSPLTCSALTPGKVNKACVEGGFARDATWLVTLNLCFSKKISLYPFPKVHGTQFCASHSQHGALLPQWGSPSVLEKNPGHQSLTTRSLCIFCGAVAGQPAQQKWNPFPKVPCLAPLMDAFQQPTNNNSNKTSNSPHQSPPTLFAALQLLLFPGTHRSQNFVFPCNPMLGLLVLQLL